MSRYFLNNVQITKEMQNKVISNCKLSVSDKFPGEGRYNIDYGFSHDCGLFIQFEPIDKSAKIEAERILGIETIIDIDGKFENLDNYFLTYILLMLQNSSENNIDYIALNCFAEEQYAR